MKTIYVAAGMVIGILAAVIAAIAFSGNEQASGQMGMMNHGSMGPGMMSTTSNTWQTNQGSFSATAGSMVDNVSVAGVAVTDDDEVTVTLRYTGTGDPDGVVVVATTNPTMLMSRMHGGMNSGMMGMGGNMMGGYGGIGSGMMYGGSMGPGMMYGQSATNPMWYNNTAWQEWHNQMAAQGVIGPGMMYGYNGTMGPGWWNSTATAPFYSWSSQTGSSAIRGGWNSGNYIIALEGDGSAYDSGQIMVMVFPLTS